MKYSPMGYSTDGQGESHNEFMKPRCFRLNDPDVSAEDFKSEILAVNLKNGYYHSLRDAAVPIWRLLIEGRHTEGIVRCLASHYGCDPVMLTADIHLFIEELEKEQLIVPEVETIDSPSATAPDWLGDFSPVYAKPLLETYTEMQDLLLLDPIHDVDVTGWPHVPEVKKEDPLSSI